MPLHVGFRLSSPKGARSPFDYIRLLSRKIMDSMYDPGPWRKQHAQEETRLAAAPPRIDWIRFGFCMVRQRAARFIMVSQLLRFSNSAFVIWTCALFCFVMP
ncbi:hypothetical protein FALCPG4_004501 [Fusarium falciforme]